MALKYILAHDFGTSGDKASLFTTEGKFVATKTTGYPSYTLSNGGVEQDPEDWWKAFCTSNRELTKGIDVADIIAIGFDGTGPNCLCIDKDGNKLNNAYIWQDVRATNEVAELEAMIPAEELQCNSDCRIHADETLPKLYWIKKNKPEIFEKIAMIFPGAQDYIIWRLTGHAATEYIHARNTTLANADNTDWSDTILNCIGFRKDQLPKIHANTDVIGQIPEHLASEVGLAAGTKLVIGSDDTWCSLIGAGVINPGDAYMNGGTSAGVLALVRKGVKAECIGGLTASSGTSFSWLKNQICQIEQKEAAETGANVYDIINEKIASAPVGSNGVMFHPYLAGERAPRHNAKAQGSFVGISLTTKREDIMRSVVEGIGFNISVILDTVRKSGIDPKSLVIVGGLGKGDITRQIFADIMNIEIKAPKYMEEAATIGGAILAGIAVGIYENEASALEKYLEITAVTKPNPENVEKYAKLKPIFEKIYEGLYDAYPNIYDAKKWLNDAE